MPPAQKTKHHDGADEVKVFEPEVREIPFKERVSDGIPVLAPESEYPNPRHLQATNPEEWEAKRPLTLRQNNYIRARMSGMSRSDAAKWAGYASHRLAAESVESSLNVQMHMQRLFAKHGITIDTLILRVAEAMGAERRELDRTGEVKLLGPDWRARVQALELAARLTGIAPDPRLKVEGTGAGGAIVVRHTASLD